MKHLCKLLVVLVVASCKNLPPPEVLDCQARVLLPYLSEDNEHNRMVRELVEAAATQDVDLETVLVDTGLTFNEIQEVRRAFKSCQPKQEQ